MNFGFTFRGYDFNYNDNTQILHIAYNQMILTKFGKIKTKTESKERAMKWIVGHERLFRPRCY